MKAKKKPLDEKTPPIWALISPRLKLYRPSKPPARQAGKVASVAELVDKLKTKRRYLNGHSPHCRTRQCQPQDATHKALTAAAQMGGDITVLVRRRNAAGAAEEAAGSPVWPRFCLPMMPV